MSKKDTGALLNFMQSTEKALTVQDFAKLMKVHPDTVRRWEKKGYIKSFRHPINNYRLFRIEALKGNSEE